jgi:hypothetical protein
LARPDEMFRAAMNAPQLSLNLALRLDKRAMIFS